MMASYKIINTNALDLPLGDGTVNMVVTSPPYYGLRNYGVDGQIGLEESMQDYINNIVLVFREVWRVMKDDGTLWLNIGDSYNQNTGVGSNANKRIDHDNRWTKQKHPKEIKQKELMGIPWRVAFALQADGWYLRQDIIWHKPNPMPESVKDRCTKAHEYIFLLTKQAKYYYDYQAILEPAAYDGRKDTSYKGGKKDISCFQHERWPNTIRGFKTKDQIEDNQHHGNDITYHEQGGIPARNKRSVWTVPTKGYKGAHFATFPPDLIVDCIKAGSKPGGIVLDPFNGSGTTGEVAMRLDRQYIGIELNKEYIALSQERLAPFRLQPNLI